MLNRYRKPEGVLAVFALAVLVSTVDSNPGFRARITQRGINYGNDLIVVALTRAVQQTQIDNQKGSDGDLKWSMNNIRIGSFNLPSSQIVLVPGSGLRWTISNANVVAEADASYSTKILFIDISDSTHVTGTFTGVSITVSFGVGYDANGKPTVSATGCSASIRDVNLQFRGGADWIYNLLSGLFNGAIRGILEGQLCNAANRMINNNVSEELRKLNMTVDVLGKFELNYSLYESPTFTSQYLETNHKGTVYWKGDQTEPPFSPPAIPQSSATDRMAYFWLSDYVANSMGYAAHRNNFLRYTLDSTASSGSINDLLQTSCSTICIGSLIPQIAERYQNSTLSLLLYTTQAPVLDLTPGFITLNMTGNADITTSNTNSVVLSLTVTVQLKISAYMESDLLKGRVDNATFTVAVGQSSVGDVEISSLNTILNGVIQEFVIPSLNEQGAKGLPLPVTGDIRLVNPQIVIEQDALMVATDVSVTV